MEVGHTIGRYRILERIATGGMGEIYRAVDLQLDRLVAIKSIRGSLREDAKAVNRLRREALMIAALDHPYICQVYELLQADSDLLLVMEFVDGKSLDEMLREGPLSTSATLRLGLEVGEALEAAHLKGIIHRDIKPSNLMVTRHGHTKIMDFGIAKEDSHTAPTNSDQTVTAFTEEGAFLGTPRYCAPEQVTRSRIDHRSDLFCLGTVLYECVTDRVPFEGKDGQAYLKNVLTAEPRPFETGASPELRQLHSIIRKCLQKDPNDRFQSATDFLSAMRSVTRHKERQKATGPGRTKTAVKYVLAALVIVGAILLALTIPSPKVPPIPGLPAQKHIVVLPFQPASDSKEMAEMEALSHGLALVAAEEFDRLASHMGSEVWAVFATAMTPDWENDRARGRSFGATLALDGRVREANGSWQIDLELLTTSSWTRLATARLEEPLANVGSFQDGVALELAEMVGEPSPELKPLLQRNNTLMASALPGYLKGTGYLDKTPRSPEELETAISLLGAALHEDPAFAAAHARLAEAYLLKYAQTRDRTWLEKAEQSALQAVAIHDRLGAYHRLLGRVYQVKGKSQEAETSFQQAVRSGDSRAFLDAAELYISTTRADEAEESLKQAVKTRQRYWPYQLELGLFYYRTGRYPEALESFEETTRLYPDSVRAWNNLGGIRIYLDQWDQARLSFSRSLQVEENYAAYSNLGALDYEEGRFADSMRHFLKALEMDDSEYWVWGNLGSAARLSPGQQERAVSAFQKAITLAERELSKNPADEHVIVDLASYYAELGDERNARAYIARLQPSKIQNPETLVRMGEACVFLKDFEQARACIEAALKLGYPPGKLQRIPELRRLAAHPSFVGLFQ